MIGRRRGDLPRYAAQSVRDQLLQAPARAVSGQHGKVVQMDGSASVRLGDLIIINFAEPVIGCDGTGIGQNKSADGIRNR